MHGNGLATLNMRIIIMQHKVFFETTDASSWSMKGNISFLNNNCLTLNYTSLNKYEATFSTLKDEYDNFDVMILCTRCINQFFRTRLLMKSPIKLIIMSVN